LAAQTAPAEARFEAYAELGGQRYRLRVDLDVSGRWRLAEGPAGSFHLTNQLLVVNVEEGVGREILGILRGGRGRLARMMEAAEQLSCLLGVPVELRVHGVRVKTLRCRREG
jgi:hypothetical protein